MGQSNSKKKIKIHNEEKVDNNHLPLELDIYNDESLVEFNKTRLLKLCQLISEFNGKYLTGRDINSLIKKYDFELYILLNEHELCGEHKIFDGENKTNSYLYHNAIKIHISTFLPISLNDKIHKYCRSIKIPNSARVYVNVTYHYSDTTFKIKEVFFTSNIVIADSMIYIDELPYWKDHRFCEDSINLNGGIIKYMSDKTKIIGVCRMAVKKHPRAIQSVPLHMRDRLYMLHISSHVWSLKDVPHKKQNNEICLISMRTNPRAFMYVAPELKSEELCLEAIDLDTHMYEYVDEEKKTENIYKKAVKKWGHYIKDVPLRFITRDLIESALRSDGSSIQFIPADLLDETLCLMAVEKTPESIKLMPEKFRTKTVIQRANRMRNIY